MPDSDKKNEHQSLFKEFNHIIDATSSFLKAIFPPIVKFMGKLKFKKKKLSKKTRPTEKEIHPSDKKE